MKQASCAFKFYYILFISLSSILIYLYMLISIVYPIKNNPFDFCMTLGTRHVRQIELKIGWGLIQPDYLIFMSR